MCFELCTSNFEDHEQLGERDQSTKFKLQSTIANTLSWLPYNRCRSARFLDLLTCALCEAMRRNFQRLGNVAVTEHNDVMLRFLDDPATVQNFGRDFGVGIEALVERFKTDFNPMLLENIGEATLRETTMQGHLSALETDLRGVAGARLLALLAAARCFAKPRTGTATNALFLVRRTFRRMQVVKS